MEEHRSQAVKALKIDEAMSGRIEAVLVEGRLGRDCPVVAPNRSSISAATAATATISATATITAAAIIAGIGPIIEAEI